MVLLTILQKSNPGPAKRVKPPKPQRQTKAAKSLNEKNYLIDSIISKTQAQYPLAKAIELFDKEPNTKEMIIAHRIGFKQYLSENQNAIIFNGCDQEERNELIKLYLQKV